MIELRRRGCFTELYVDGQREKCGTDFDEIKRYADVRSAIKGEPVTEAKPKPSSKFKKKRVIIRILETEEMFG